MGPRRRRQPTVDMVRSLARAHPLAAFLALAYSSAVIVFALPLLSADGIGIVAMDLPGVAPFVFVATLALLGAACVVSWSLGPTAVADLRTRVFRLRIDMRWYLLACYILPASALLTAVIARGSGPLRGLMTQPGLLVGTVTLGAVAAFVLINWWEEAAWTGFVVDRLQPRLGAVGASVITTWMQAGVHLPLVFIADGVTDGRVPPGRIGFYLAALFVLPIPVRALMTWLYNATGHSVPAVGLLHAGLGVATGDAFLPVIAPGFDTTWVYAGITAVAVAVLIATRGSLRPRCISGPVSPSCRLTSSDPFERNDRGVGGVVGRPGASVGARSRTAAQSTLGTAVRRGARLPLVGDRGDRS